MMRFTDCECDQPGWCSRHQCVKSGTLFHLCRRNRQWFDMWEVGRGPCLPVPEDMDAVGEADSPGLLRRAMNFGAAVARHATNLCTEVDQVTYDARLATCLQCPSCDLAQLMCREQTCGCFVRIKARWASETCPLHKWPEIGEHDATVSDISAGSQPAERPG